LPESADSVLPVLIARETRAADSLGMVRSRKTREAIEAAVPEHAENV
jgi:hypothetical protein